MDESDEKRSIHKKIMATRGDYVDNDIFYPDEAIAAAVDKRKLLLKRLLEDQGRFPKKMNLKETMAKSLPNACNLLLQ